MRTGIVGLGLIGASLGGALVRAGYEVAGFDVDPANAGIALEHGFVSRLASSPEEAVADADLAVLAMPLHATVSMLPAVSAMMPPGSVITDVASVKGLVIDGMNALSAVRAVGGHPIAGRETSGAEFADADMFRGATYAVVPSVRSDPESVQMIQDLARAVGAVPIQVSAAKHDAALARTSHLPQLVSTALAATLAGDCRSPLAGQGLRDMTRLAGSNKDLWAEIFEVNSVNVLAALRRLIGTLEHWETLLDDADVAALAEAIEAGRSAVSKSPMAAPKGIR
jgi:prephenate dehydrogenase